MVFCLVAVLSFKGEDEGLGTAARGRAPVLLGLPDLSLPRWPFTSCEPHRPAVRGVSGSENTGGRGGECEFPAPSLGREAAAALS